MVYLNHVKGCSFQDCKKFASISCINLQAETVFWKFLKRNKTFTQHIQSAQVNCFKSFNSSLIGIFGYNLTTLAITKRKFSGKLPFSIFFQKVPRVFNVEQSILHNQFEVMVTELSERSTVRNNWLTRNVFRAFISFRF